MKTRTVGGVQPAMRQRAVQTLQAVTLSILPSQQPILSQPIGIITGNVAKSYQIKCDYVNGQTKARLCRQIYVYLSA